MTSGEVTPMHSVHDPLRSENGPNSFYEPKITKEQMKEMRIILKPPVAIFPQTVAEYNSDVERSDESGVL